MDELSTPEEKEALRRALRAQGAKGGKATLHKHGASHFSRIVKKRWQKEKQRKNER